jgi:hypothetical protein
MINGMGTDAERWDRAEEVLAGSSRIRVRFPRHRALCAGVRLLAEFVSIPSAQNSTAWRTGIRSGTAVREEAA